MKKREYPKTVLRKKLIKGAFWTVFALVLFLSVVAIVRVGNAGAGEAAEKPGQQETQRKVNIAAGEGAQSFATNFATNYFNWENTDAGKKNRVERLKPYLATGLDEQAGLSFDGMEWNSSHTKFQVWGVEETGDDTALITLRVQHALTKTTQSDPKAAEAAKKTPSKVKEEKAGPYEKYFVVPVKTDGQAFVVHKVPYFIAAPKKPAIISDTAVNEDGKISDSKLQDEITSGLNTFFKVYTTGTQDELSYYVKDEDVQTMTGIITFKEVKDTVIKRGKAKNEYQVYANVVFQENQSKGQVVYPYMITLVKEEDRWFVKSLKNQ